MVKIIKSSLVAFALVGLSACVSTNDIKVNSEQSSKVDLSGYKTYQYVEGSGIAKDTTQETVMQDLKVSANIESIINKDMLLKGKTIVSKNPDFFVAYLGGVDRKTVKSKLKNDAKKSIENIPEAALVLMFVDADDGKVIWMSTAEAEFKDVAKEEKKKRIEYAISKMLDSIK
jgi:hypothetical protein